MMWTVLLLGALGSVAGIEHSFTSMNSMHALVATEGKVIQALKDIIEQEKDRLGLLRRYVSYYESAHKSAMDDAEGYVTNPINSYQLIKRLTSDWEKVEGLITAPIIVNITEVKQSLDLPVPADLGGAAEGLCRLQDTYKLGTSEMAKGIIRGVQYSQSMTAFDALELGRQMYGLKDYYHAAKWFQVSLRLHDDEIDKQPLHKTSKATILDYLAFSMNTLGDVHTALQLTDEYLDLQPNCERNKANRIIYIDAMRNGSKARPLEESQLIKNMPRGSYFDSDTYVNYEKLCRGEAEVNHRLVCRYEDNNNPYLRLGKLKLEELNLDPFIVVFHDVIFDSEIQKIQELARPNIARSSVRDFTTAGSVQTFNRDRVSQTAFLWKYDHIVVNNVDRRAAIMANLTDLASENLQVLNYGIGGHYSPHLDYAQTTGRDFGFPGFNSNRVATLLFYMSDVEQGGATVFPEIGVAVFPRKGSALLWYNLHRDGEGDARTRHGACPVLIGSKWACNKWFHEETQEFSRPCLLEQDSLRYQPAEVASVPEDVIINQPTKL